MNLNIRSKTSCPRIHSIYTSEITCICKILVFFSAWDFKKKKKSLFFHIVIKDSHKIPQLLESFVYHEFELILNYSCVLPVPRAEKILNHLISLFLIYNLYQAKLCLHVCSFSRCIQEFVASKKIKLSTAQCCKTWTMSIYSI